MAQRDAEQHAQHAAGRADRQRLPEREALPVAQHHQPGQDKDDRRQGARGRGLRLHHVVFEDIGAGEEPQHGHRDHGSRDRRREGQADLQAQVDVGGGEHDRDQRTEDDAAQGQFRQGNVVGDTIDT
ncbi:hypothetical protein D3C72_1990510 [compost metagenome]